ncbi:helix-turn-helix domain-containing protein [Azospirillum argentinense]|uniref:Helix-turn-helix domain-containing protein n=2 Tax=Azospirillum argentinense TaxID=2970906 RepID=A0A4D8PAM1_9PROT|nr:helix-turn-helix domain-containing protein [Azospirillum argentinense]
MVWPARGIDGTAKLVLQRLCDFADDDGGNVFPTIKRVSEDCGISERTTQEAMRRLEAIRVLVLVREGDAGAKRPREYRIDVDALASLAVAKEGADGCEIRTGAKSARVQKTIGTGADSAPKPIIEPTKGAADVGARPRSQLVTVGMQVLRIVGVADDPNWLGNYSRVSKWLADGADPEQDIFPTVERIMARRGAQGPPRSLEYFDRAIADAIASRTRPLPEGNPNVERRQVPRHPRRNAWAVAAERHAQERAGGADGPRDG